VESKQVWRQPWDLEMRSSVRLFARDENILFCPGQRRMTQFLDRSAALARDGLHNTDHESIWLRPADKSPGRTPVSVPVRYGKVMVNIAWNPTGLHIMYVVGKEYRFNTSYH
jgi:hypothetical protein